MKKHFYSHIITVESLFVELDSLKMTKEEKEELTQLAHANLHHTIMDTILSELTEDDKKLFLRHLVFNDHNTIWRFLKKRIGTAEEKIKNAGEALLGELHKDIKTLKKNEK